MASRTTRAKVIARAIESIASNVDQDATAAEWVANIRYQLQTHWLDESDAKVIAKAFGLDWTELLRQYKGETT